jgi:hypothetical protein
MDGGDTPYSMPSCGKKSVPSPRFGTAFDELRKHERTY